MRRATLSADDVVAQARGLLGVEVVSRAGGLETVGRIVETEAYRGRDDRASHAYPLKRTPRTAVMFGPAGHAYVYLCYGIHRMLNVVCGPRGEPNAILIRALEPVRGVEVMLERRGLRRVQRRLAGGPGLVCQALGITLADDGTDLCEPGGRLWLSGSLGGVAAGQVVASPRVGVGYAGADAGLPWRFRLRNSPFTSPAK